MMVISHSFFCSVFLATFSVVTAIHNHAITKTSANVYRSKPERSGIFGVREGFIANQIHGYRIGGFITNKLRGGSIDVLPEAEEEAEELYLPGLLDASVGKKTVRILLYFYYLCGKC